MISEALGRGKGTQTPSPCPTPPSPLTNLGRWETIFKRGHFYRGEQRDISIEA